MTLTKKVFDPNMSLPDGRKMDTFVMRIEATVEEGDSFPPEIFIWHAYNIANQSAGDKCEAVCRVADLSTFPANAPQRTTDAGQNIPFYRLAYAEFHCLSESEVADVWVSVQDDVNDLAANWIAANTIDFEDEVVEISTSA